MRKCERVYVTNQNDIFWYVVSPNLTFFFFFSLFCQAVCTEAGMFALRERRIHVTQEDFEMAVAKVMKKETEKNMSLRKLWK